MNWSQLAALFGENDGSLPDIHLLDLSGEQVIEGYETVKSWAQKISSTGACFWSLSKQCEVPIAIDDNPAALVVSGEAECFHLCFEGILSPSRGVVPELGVHVFNNSLSFDYRKGPDWNEDALEGLFQLIYKVIQGVEEVRVEHEGNCNDPGGAIFAEYWRDYFLEMTANGLA